MPITLRALSPEQLRLLAAGTVPAALAASAEAGALPPAFVAARTLAQQAAGELPTWCGNYLMLRRADQRFVGGCGFKFAPSQRQVEIGYAVAPSARRQGIATAAVTLLLRQAFSSGAVDTVLAHVNPQNLASSRVLATLGFVPGPAVVDADQEVVIPWCKARRQQQ
jgi:[ribosomal protein S5]-alanine N-acetyltransferase